MVDFLSVHWLIDPRRKGLLWKVLLVAFTAVYIALILAGTIDSNRKLGPAEYALIAFVALFVGNFFDKLAELSFGKDGLSFRLNTVEQRQDRAEDTLKAIQITLTGLLSKYEYAHLRGLDMPEAYPCKYGDILFNEIKRLDSIEFLRPTSGKGFNAIHDEHQFDGNDFNLKQYVEITDKGKSYLSIRSKLEEEMRAP